MRDFRRSRLAADAAAGAVCGLLDGGRLLLYDGRKPADPDAPADQVPIAAMFFDNPSFRRDGSGRAEAMDIYPDLQVRREGRPTWFRAVTHLGAAVFDGTVGPSGGAERYDLELDSVDVTLDDEVRVERLVYIESN